MKEDIQEVLRYDYFIYYNIIGIFSLLIDKRKCTEREFEANERRHVRSPPLQLFYLLQYH